MTENNDEIHFQSELESYKSLIEQVMPEIEEFHQKCSDMKTQFDDAQMALWSIRNFEKLAIDMRVAFEDAQSSHN